MAFIHGKNAEVLVGSDDISVYLESADLSIDTDAADISVFGSDWKGSQPGQSSGKLDLAGKYDATATTGPIDVLDALRAAPGEVTFYPQGNAVGRHKYVGNFHLTNLTASSPVGGIVAFKASLVSDGAIVKSAVV